MLKLKNKNGITLIALIITIESAKRQREIDKANFKAQKMETKAFYQEQKAKRNPEVRKMVQEQAYQKQMAEAKARQEAAQMRIDEAKNNQ